MSHNEPFDRFQLIGTPINGVTEYLKLTVSYSRVQSSQVRIIGITTGFDREYTFVVAVCGR